MRGDCDCFLEQRVFGAEVAKEGDFIHAGSFGDAACRGAAGAVLSEYGRSGFE